MTYSHSKNMNLPKPYYQDDAVTLYHGDCREIVPMLGQFDAVVSDPPYGDSATHSKHLSKITLRNGEPARQALGFDGISQDDAVAMAKHWCQIAARWVVFTAEWQYMHALEDAGILVRFGIWRKPDGAPQFTGDRPGTGWEAVAICHRRGKKRWNGGGRHAFWSFPKGENNTGHPTGKPDGLFLELVTLFTEPGETILDPFAGSGTTGRAAKDLGRKCVMIEREERYCEIAARRMGQEVLPL
jgi:DNA modification methylase